VTTIPPPPLSLLIFSLLIPWFVIYTHRSNISRLRNGNENQFKNAMIFRRNS
jgi:glycerol-3-phosphate acyltransferase PlsY